MKRVTFFSSIVALTIGIFALMSFSSNYHPPVTVYCFDYISTFPVDDTKVVTSTNYAALTPGTTLSCTPPRERFCGFCIEDSSPYFDAVTKTPKWTNAGFQALLQNGSPIEVYNNTSLHGTSIGSGITVYFEQIPL